MIMTTNGSSPFDDATVDLAVETLVDLAKNSDDPTIREKARQALNSRGLGSMLDED